MEKDSPEKHPAKADRRLVAAALALAAVTLVTGLVRGMPWMRAAPAVKAPSSGHGMVVEKAPPSLPSDGPWVRNTANCGPVWVPVRAQMDCAGERTLGVVFDRTVLRFDEGEGGADMYCRTQRECVPAGDPSLSLEEVRFFKEWRARVSEPRSPAP